MFFVTDSDLMTIRQVCAAEGREAGMAVLRRRWPGVAERCIPSVLDRVLAMSIATTDRRQQPGDKIRLP